MTDNKRKNDDTVDALLKRGQEFLNNDRHIILRTADGKELLDVSMTVAFISAGVLLFFGPAGFTLALLAVIAGIVMKVRVEVVRELNDDDDTVVINNDDSA
jgi:hypothetical protein